jgi:hypothetical protein
MTPLTTKGTRDEDARLPTQMKHEVGSKRKGTDAESKLSFVLLRADRVLQPHGPSSVTNRRVSKDLIGEGAKEGTL